MTNHPVFQFLRQAGDISAVGLIVGSFVSWLPSIASALSILWFLVRFYDRFRYGPRAARAGEED